MSCARGPPPRSQQGIFVIRLDGIGKQHGRQILFMEASAAINRGEKVGLVGPNGSGKTTIFRLITKEEQPDGGQVSVDRGMTIGYFSQDVGEMTGKSVVAETMDGAGPISAVASELRDLEAALADPDRLGEMEALVDRFGHVQARYEELGGYALDACFSKPDQLAYHQFSAFCGLCQTFGVVHAECQLRSGCVFGCIAGQLRARLLQSRIPAFLKNRNNAFAT